MAVGLSRESGWTLARHVFAGLLTRGLLLGDQLYSCLALVAQALAMAHGVRNHFLYRARTMIMPQIVRRLRDGSRLIRDPVRDPQHPSRIVDGLEVREIRVRIGRAGRQARILRLWTSF